MINHNPRRAMALMFVVGILFSTAGQLFAVCFIDMFRECLRTAAAASGIYLAQTPQEAAAAFRSCARLMECYEIHARPDVGIVILRDPRVGREKVKGKSDVGA